MRILILVLGSGCASVPTHRYGVNDLSFDGMDELTEAALGACLATQPRDKVTLQLSPRGKPECGEPPFDEGRLAWRWFAWPWTDWPVFDAAVFRLDLERIERWYQARGYYGARVLDVEYDPAEVAFSDEAEKCDDSCAVDITITVEEGEPVLIRNIEIEGLSELPEPVREDLWDAVAFEAGDAFDEAFYDRTLQALAKVMRIASYARASVEGEVVIHRALGVADVGFSIAPGPVCKIGRVRVESPVSIPEEPILAASMLEPGQQYDEDALDDAQQSIYELGAFSSVTVRGEVEQAEGEVVDVVIDVQPRRRSEINLGVGIMSGQLTTGPYAADWVSVPQWDVHLLASYEHRNFFGGLRRFRVEDRPRLLFLEAFPRVPDNSPRFGNLFSAEFSQPGVLDPRTTLFVEARWDHGPDPFQLFFRDDFGLALGLRRGFFKQQLKARVALHQELMRVDPDQPAFVLNSEIYQEQPPSSYRLPFAEQQLELDLRDDPIDPALGAYLRVIVHEAVRIWEPSWTYVRVTPDARGYVPLGFGIVLAARFALGSLHIFQASDALNPQMRRLGPPTYRLRGGGATSNRGFLPGQLGDSEIGGKRKWEGSLEVRVPLGTSLSLVAFGDVGDVHAGERFRFRQLNTALGGGLRYDTIVGPVRLDVGYRVPGLQRADDSEPSDEESAFGRWSFPGAIHLTLGEAF